MTAVPGLAEQVYVFWADKMTGDNFGDPAVISGYGQLAEISRPVSGATWPSTGRSEIPLGDNNAQPSQKKA